MIEAFLKELSEIEKKLEESSTPIQPAVVLTLIQAFKTFIQLQEISNGKP